MKHFSFHGTHYDAGFQQGRTLLERGERLPEQIPFPVTPQRLAFARACLPAYRRWFPGALEELRGLAEGQGCSFDTLAGALLPMYCMAPQPRCSCFAVRRGAEVLLGRNSDFLTALEAQNASCLYRLEGSRALIGNTTAFVELEDGVNDRGLAVGLTSVWPGPLTPGLNAGMLLRLVLETCSGVAEALELLRRVPTASSHTLVLADRTGDLALAESRGGQLALCRPTGRDAFVCAVNTYHLPELAPFNCPEEDNWQAEERWRTMTAALETGVGSLREAMDLLGGRRGFLCQYDRSSGHDTVWSAVYGLSAGRVFRAEGNPLRTPFREDRRLGGRQAAGTVVGPQAQ